MRFRLLTVGALAAVLAATAGSAVAAPIPAAADTKKPRANIVQTAVKAGQFKTLVSLVQSAGLAGTLSGKGQYTVFAPTDAAFAKVPKATLDALAQDKAALQRVLLYHTAKGRLTSKAVVRQKSIKTLAGPRLAVKVKGKRVTIGGARITKVDVAASNGVIHVIDRVLIPPARGRVATQMRGPTGETGSPRGPPSGFAEFAAQGALLSESSRPEVWRYAPAVSSPLVISGVAQRAPSLGAVAPVSKPHGKVQRKCHESARICPQAPQTGRFRFRLHHLPPGAVAWCQTPGRGSERRGATGHVDNASGPSVRQPRVTA